MPNNLEKIEKAQSEFNKKYAVDFDIEAFEESMNFYDDMGTDLGLNNLYKQAFIPLYKKAFTNFIDGKIGKTFDVGVMINDFENIMEPFRDERSSKNKKSPAFCGGWTVKEYLNSMLKATEDVPDNKLDYAAKRYSKGELRIRDMRAYAEDLKKDPTAEKLATLHCYAESLMRANKERPLFWRAIFLFRHLAEQREAENFKKYIAEVTGNSDGKIKLEEVLENVNNTLISDSKKIVNDAMVRAENAENTQKTSEQKKEKLSVDDAAPDKDRQQITEKVIKDSELVKNGYEIKK